MMVLILAFGVSSKKIMSQVLWNAVLSGATTLGIVALALTPTLAAEAQPETEQAEPMAQVTSVSQLSDVQPTDWAFQALQSLVERYGCIAGYPDGTFKGNRAVTRYELAAALNACLDQISARIATQEDLEIVKALQTEFKAELATLKGRVDSLEAQTAQLEANQFSTTTKLSGEVIFAVTGAAFGNRIRNSNTTPGISPSGDISFNGEINPTFVGRVRLNLSTSFTGKDLLYTQLQTGNGGQTAAVVGQDPGLGGNVRFSTFDLDYAGAGPNVALNYLYYVFPITKDLQASIGPVDSVNNYVDLNTYTNDEAQNFSSTFFKNNPLLFPVPGGAVASLRWKPGGKALGLNLVYVAGAAQSPIATPTNDQGLFGSPYQGTVELEYAPKNFAIRLQYTRATVNDRDFNVGGLNVEWAVSSKVGLFGRYGYGSIEGRVPGSFDGFAETTFTGTTLHPSTWSAGIAFSDLFIKGARGAIAVGQPFIEGNIGNSTQTNIEAFYKIPIQDNIAITPDIQFIFNPNNNSANSTITVGTIRMVFTF